MKRKKPRPIKAWGWMMRTNGGPWGLCYWAHPRRDDCVAEQDQNDEMRIVRVMISAVLPKRRKKKRGPDAAG